MIKRVLLLSVIFLSMQSCSAMDLKAKIHELANSNIDGMKTARQIVLLLKQDTKSSQQREFLELLMEADRVSARSLEISQKADCNQTQSIQEVQQAIDRAQALNQKFENHLQGMLQEIGSREAKK